MLVGEVVLTLESNHSLQHFVEEFFVEGLQAVGVLIENIVDVRREVSNGHIEEVVPTLRVAHVLEFLIALLDESQAVAIANRGQQHLTDEAVVKPRHAEIVGCAQDFDDEVRVIGVGCEKGDVLGLQVVEDEEVGLLGDPVGEGEGVLGKGRGTSAESLMSLLSDSLASRSRLRRKDCF